MGTRSVTTSTGTEIHLVAIRDIGDVVVLDNPAAPDDMRHHHAGRVVDGGFQPHPLAAFGLRPETLRAIADLIEAQS